MYRERVSQNEWVRRRLEVLPGYLANELLSQHSGLVGTIGEQSTSPFFVANQWLVRQLYEFSIFLRPFFLSFLLILQSTENGPEKVW